MGEKRKKKVTELRLIEVVETVELCKITAGDEVGHGDGGGRRPVPDLHQRETLGLGKLIGLQTGFVKMNFLLYIIFAFLKVFFLFFFLIL